MLKISMEEYYKLLFNDDEGVCIASESTRSFVVPVSDVIPHEKNVWVALNPMKPYTARKVENVTAFRNLLIEFDNIPLDDQLTIMEELKIPLSCVTYSGNKSYHFIIALSKDVGPEQYDKYFKWISAVLEGRNDQSMSPANTYTRVANAIRNDEKTEHKDVVQAPAYLASRVKPSDLDSFLAQYPSLEPLEKKEVDQSNRDADGGEYELLKPFTRNFIETGASGNDIGRHVELKLSAIDVYEAGYDADTAYDMLAPNYLARYDDKDEQEVRRLLEWVYSNL